MFTFIPSCTLAAHCPPTRQVCSYSHTQSKHSGTTLDLTTAHGSVSSPPRRNIHPLTCEPDDATLTVAKYMNLVRVHPPTYVHLSYLSVCLCISSCMLSHVHYKASIQVSCLHAHCWSNKCYHPTQSTYYIIYYNYYISTIFDTVTLKDSQL